MEIDNEDLSGLPPAVAKQFDSSTEAQKRLAETPSQEPEEEDSEVIGDTKEEEVIPLDSHFDEPEPKASEESIDWEHKYKTFEGIHKKNISDMKARLDDLTAQIGQYTQVIKNQSEEIDNLKSAGVQQQVTPGLNPEDYSDYGEDMVKLASLVNSLAEENKKLKEGVIPETQKIKNLEERIHLSDQDRFFNAVSREVPNWEEINRDQRWLDWLSDTDPLSGVKRQEVLNYASNGLNASGVAKVFKAFLAETGTQDPAPADRLSAQVVPKRSPVAAPAGKHAISRADYMKAAKDVSTGRLSPEDFDKLSTQFQRSLQRGAR